MVRTGIRASAIIIKDNKILLIHRKNNGEEYWVFPGGGIEEGETPDATVVREIKEETNLDASNVKFVFEMETYKGGNKHPFFFVDVGEGDLKMGGEESGRDQGVDWYNPEWVEISKVSEINLVPEGAKAKLIEKWLR